MKTIKSARAMSSLARKLIASGETIGLVPTMGYLHEGHMSLVDIARKKSSTVVVTLFVNPTQFGPGEDFKNYPRNTRRDLQMLNRRGADYVFMPTVSAMYPKDYKTYVTVEGLTDSLEGKYRPGHFRGVTTIVTKLFNICRPDVAVFGQKDYQQVIVLRKMTTDLDFPIKFVIAPTVREKDGLAMSSRNSYFNDSQRTEAVCLYRGLQAARAAFRAGKTNPAFLAEQVQKTAKQICQTVVFDYVAVTDFDSLSPSKRAKKGDVLSVAARVHGVRLIDNIRL